MGLFLKVEKNNVKILTKFTMYKIYNVQDVNNSVTCEKLSVYVKNSKIYPQWD